MKKIIHLYFIITLLLFTVSGCSQMQKPEQQKWNYAIEIGGVLCGYSESVQTPTIIKGKDFLQLNEKAFVQLSALGGNVDMKIYNKYLINPLTENPVSVEHSMATTAELYAFTKFENNVAFFVSKRGGEPTEINLPAGVVLENTVSYPHLLTDFIRGSKKEKSYRVFDYMQGKIITKNYKLLGEEKIELAGKTYDAVVLEELNMSMGTTTILWLNKENSLPLKLDILGRLIYLTDKSVKRKIKVVNMDNILFARVNKIIQNVPDISYMKIEAKIKSGGEWITPETLNFPGQKFEGTVSNNVIEGVFEIEPIRYKGENSPSFPTIFNNDKIKRYTEPERLIESDEQVLIDKAREITDGSKNTWEAVVRLSKWVAKNIKGEIPGGTSAINTFNIRKGDCGSHSRLLTAFCRAVGIPARLSIGCMYGSYLGGSFGQHGWTEVYMGDTGWVAVDATAFEYDFIDAGHIRLGEKTSFYPQQMKIIDYRIISNKKENPGNN